MTYLIIAIVLVAACVAVFIRRKPSAEYHEVPFLHSGKQWRFDGLLNIDCPPEDVSVYSDYPGHIQLVTKKGFVQFDMALYPGVSDDVLGLYWVEVAADDARHSISILRHGHVIGHLSGQQQLAASVAKRGKSTPAYCFVARNPDTREFYGAACIGKWTS